MQSQPATNRWQHMPCRCQEASEQQILSSFSCETGYQSPVFILAAHLQRFQATRVLGWFSHPAPSAISREHPATSRETLNCHHRGACASRGYWREAKAAAKHLTQDSPHSGSYLAQRSNSAEAEKTSLIRFSRVGAPGGLGHPQTRGHWTRLTPGLPPQQP